VKNNNCLYVKEMNMTRFTHEIAEQAIEIAMPFINQIMEQEERNGLQIYVSSIMSDTIMAKRTIGDHSEWKNPYDLIAANKMKVTCRTELSSREVQLLYPEMVGGDGDTIYWGSWIDGGIVVAISGLPPEWDEACSKHICAIIRALLTTQSKQDFASGNDFTWLLCLNYEEGGIYSSFFLAYFFSTYKIYLYIF